MQGFRRAAVHIALVALFLRAFLPAGWMPGAPGDAPLVMCGMTAVHDTADGKEVPIKSDSGGECAFAFVPALPAPEMAVLFAPGLRKQDHENQTSFSQPAPVRPHARPSPRAPPTLV